MPPAVMLQRVARRAASLWRRQAPGTGALILLYHRIAEPSCDPQRLSVSPAHFAEQLALLAGRYRLMPLGALWRALREGASVDGSVVVTFDDGYADNLHAAKPLLEASGVPATVFVAAGAVGAAEEFWWDALEGLLLQPGGLPAEGALRLGGHTVEWDLGADALYDQGAFVRHRDWTVECADTPTARHRLYRRLCGLLKPLPAGERCAVMEQLYEWAQRSPAARPSHRTLLAGEVRELARDGLIEVGAHTMTHPMLSRLSASDQLAEIRDSKIVLERLLGHPVDSFAYPFGTRHDYTRHTVEAVKAAGFSRACANRMDRACRGDRIFELPRLLVRDWDGGTLHRRLAEWRHG